MMTFDSCASYFFPVKDCTTTRICMARPPMLLLLLTLTTIGLDSCQAIYCFRRQWTQTVPAVNVDNGTVEACPSSATACYSVTFYGQNLAGCTSNGKCGVPGPDCYVCSTDYCNSMSPSSISCFWRSGSYQNNNGSVVACHSGVSACYSFMSYTKFMLVQGRNVGSSYAGCGNINMDSKQPFFSCNSSLCNSRTPPNIRCYLAIRSSTDSSPNANAMACPTGIKTCYVFDDGFDDYVHGAYSTYYAGCGSCNSTANPTCVTCSSDRCNSATPSIISCYRRQEMYTRSAISNGQNETCQRGITTCYSFVASGPSFYGGCGSCSADTIPSCQTCRRDNCNTIATGTLTCATFTYGNTIDYVSCSRGINSCYSLKRPIGRLNRENRLGNLIGGCGVCTPTTKALFGCTMCNTNNCNSVAQVSTAPATLAPHWAAPLLLLLLLLLWSSG